MVSLRSLLAISTLALTAIAAPIESRQTTCFSGVYLVVARGSDEAAGEGAPGAVADAVVAQVPNSGSVAVDYPASVIDPPYPASVSDGINDAISKVKAYVDACGDSARVALVGFSQGGNVMTDALAGGVGKPDPLTADYTKHIVAVTVFGDPTFTNGQSFDVGSADGDGIFSRGGDSLAKLNTFASILQSYCDNGDPFCDKGTSTTVHGQEVPNHQDAAVSFIVSKLG